MKMHSNWTLIIHHIQPCLSSPLKSSPPPTSQRGSTHPGDIFVLGHFWHGLRVQRPRPWFPKHSVKSSNTQRSQSTCSSSSLLGDGHRLFIWRPILFPPVPKTLTRFTRACSVAFQSHPAIHDPKLTQEGGGVGVRDQNKDRTPKVPVRGRNRTSRKVPSIFHLNPPLSSPCQWLTTLFWFINHVWICNQTSD